MPDKAKKTTDKELKNVSGGAAPPGADLSDGSSDKYPDKPPVGGAFITKSVDHLQAGAAAPSADVGPGGGSGDPRRRDPDSGVTDIDPAVQGGAAAGDLARSGRQPPPGGSDDPGRGELDSGVTEIDPGIQAGAAGPDLDSSSSGGEPDTKSTPDTFWGAGITAGASRPTDPSTGPGGDPPPEPPVTDIDVSTAHIAAGAAAGDPSTDVGGPSAGNPNIRVVINDSDLTPDDYETDK